MRAELTLLTEACDWAASLRLADVPDDVRRLAEAQTLSILGAVQASLRHPVGQVLGRAYAGDGWAEAAALASALSMALDFDETLFAGHTSHSAALVPLACGAAAGATGERVLVAQVAANEIAARVTAALTLGRARGQTAAYTHLAGTVIGAGVVMGYEPSRLAAALALALAQPVSTIYPAFMGSGAKFAVAATPIRQAAAALRQADAGLQGLPDVMEAHQGLLEELAEVPLPEALAAYGERWHLRTLSIKHFPGCAYLSAAVDAANELQPQLPRSDGDGTSDLSAVDGVEVSASMLTVGMEAESAPFIRGPDSPLPALNFSLGYNLAAALEQGRVEVEDFHRPRLESAGRWALAGRVRLHHDRQLTMRCLSATAPLGAALAWAGERARRYLEKRGATPETAGDVLDAAAARCAEHFVQPSKEVGARLSVTLRDGRKLSAERIAAIGSCGEPVERRLELAEAKYTSQLEARRQPIDGRVLRAQIGAMVTLSPDDLKALWQGQRFGVTHGS